MKMDEILSEQHIEPPIVEQKSELILHKKEEIIPIPSNFENKVEIMERIEKFKRIYKTNKDADLKSEIDELELELNKITDYELKLYEYEERFSIIEIDGNLPVEVVQSEVQKMIFRTECDSIDKNGKITHHYLPKNMILTDDGFLVGLDAYEFKRNAKGN